MEWWLLNAFPGPVPWYIIVSIWSFGATVNQHPSGHHEGWMISGQQIVFCWVPVL